MKRLGRMGALMALICITVMMVCNSGPVLASDGHGGQPPGENSSSSSVSGSPPASPAPTSPLNLWMSLIPVGVPLVLAGLKALVPRIPGVWLPVLAPILGCAADLALHFAGAAHGPPGVVGALLGASGVGLRELADQVGKAAGVRASG